MAIEKKILHRKNALGTYDTYYLQTGSDVVMRPNDTTVEKGLTDIETRVENIESKTTYDSDIILANITKTSLNLPDNSNISDALVSLKTNPASPYKIGDILTTTRTDLGDDWLLCDGSTYDITKYKPLHDYMNDNVISGMHGMFIAPDTNLYRDRDDFFSSIGVPSSFRTVVDEYTGAFKYYMLNPNSIIKTTQGNITTTTYAYIKTFNVNNSIYYYCNNKWYCVVYVYLQPDDQLYDTTLKSPYDTNTTIKQKWYVMYSIYDESSKKWGDLYGIPSKEYQNTNTDPYIVSSINHKIIIYNEYYDYYAPGSVKSSTYLLSFTTYQDVVYSDALFTSPDRLKPDTFSSIDYSNGYYYFSSYRKDGYTVDACMYCTNDLTTLNRVSLGTNEPISVSSHTVCSFPIKYLSSANMLCMYITVRSDDYSDIYIGRIDLSQTNISIIRNHETISTSTFYTGTVTIPGFLASTQYPLKIYYLPNDIWLLGNGDNTTIVCRIDKTTGLVNNSSEVFSMPAGANFGFDNNNNNTIPKNQSGSFSENYVYVNSANKCYMFSSYNNTTNNTRNIYYNEFDLQTLAISPTKFLCVSDMNNTLCNSKLFNTDNYSPMILEYYNGKLYKMNKYSNTPQRTFNNIITTDINLRTPEALTYLPTYIKAK